jgi:hypothetical protein
MLPASFTGSDPTLPKLQRNDSCVEKAHDKIRRARAALDKVEAA